MTNSFTNNYGITKITLKRNIHAYCRLGDDWYTNKLTISFVPHDEIPDYVFIDNEIKERCEKQDLLIEEVIATIRDIVREHCPTATDIKITSYVDDSVPRDMQVEVELSE